MSKMQSRKGDIYMTHTRKGLEHITFPDPENQNNAIRNWVYRILFNCIEMDEPEQVKFS